MTFDKIFCSSPWIHASINNAGHYEYCRWATKQSRNQNTSITQTAPAEFFQKHMQVIRSSMLAGEQLPTCNQCYQMEQHGKVSGRQKQLLKIGVNSENFNKTMLSSPWVSACSVAETTMLPQDWQVDLGNFCNSACVFCSPDNSSKLATEFKKLKIINQLPPASWCNDPKNLSQFIDTLSASPALKYIHFIGGETLITPAFGTILRALIDQELHKDVTIGFTTNLTTWDDEVCQLLTKFREVNLGVSIECFDKLNDYVRWPSNIATVQSTLKSWQDLATNHHWLLQLRTTPTLLTVGKLLTIYEYAWQNNVAVESCNFLERPEFLRISVLPAEYRRPIIQQMRHWLDQHKSSSATVINIRNPKSVKAQVVQDLQSYVNYLETEIDESYRLVECTQYLKLLESNRKNSVLDYLPEYEELFRSAGY